MKTLPFLVLCLLLHLAFPPEARTESLDNPVVPMDFQDIVRSARAQVFPTVVFVRVVRESLREGEKSMRESLGSGVLITDDGEVLTNWHVIDQAVEIRCLLHDGQAFTATLLGADKDMDIALLKLDLAESAPRLPAARLGDSTQLSEGDFVMAIGAPWGLSRSVSIGIISCANRYLPEASEYSLWLQTDAAISPGNSGGPLINTEGEVIGINSRGILIGGDTGFAIPSSVIHEILPALRRYRQIPWSFTGLELQPLKDFNRNIYFDAEEGVIVASVDAGSPAFEAGLAIGDRIIAVEANPITARVEEDLPDLRRRLALKPIGEPVALRFVRDGQVHTSTLTPREKGSVEGETLDLPRWDFTAKAINRFETPDLFFFRTEGVYVLGVRRPGNAVSANLSTRDILLEVDGKPVRTIEDLRQAHADALEALPAKRRVMITVLRAGQRRQLVLDYARDHHRR